MSIYLLGKNTLESRLHDCCTSKIVSGQAKFNILHQMTALSGNYVNFGVFELYGDRALSDALDAALKMTLSIPMSDILAYRKVCKLFSCHISPMLCALQIKFAIIK